MNKSLLTQALIKLVSGLLLICILIFLFIIQIIDSCTKPDTEAQPQRKIPQYLTKAQAKQYDKLK